MTVAEPIRTPPEPAWLMQRWRDRVAAQSDQLALVGEGRSLTFAEMDTALTVLAEAMTLASPDPSVPVPVASNSRFDAVVATYAGMQAGRPVALLGAAVPAGRLAELVGSLGARAAVVDAHHAALLPPGVAVIDPAELPAEPRGLEFHRPDPGDAASIVFTSGSTGRPKGAITTFGGLAFFVRARLECDLYGPGDRLGLTLAPSFGAARFLLFGLLSGSGLHLFDPAGGGPRPMLDWLAAERISVLVLTPSLFRDAVELLPRGVNFPALRMVTPVADKVFGADVHALWGHFNPDAHFCTHYGSSEAGAVTLADLGPGCTVPDGPLAVGSPFPGVDVWIDEANEQGVGKIVVRSPGVAPGYWDDPVLSASVLRPDPERPGGRVLISGDHGRIVEGQLVFMGRRDAMVKVRGYSVDLSEVERRLTGLADVREVVVSTDEPAKDRLRVIAHVVPARTGVTVSGLRSQLAEWLPAYMLPAAIVFCDRLPRSDRGKVLTDELPPVAPVRPALDVAFVAPTTVVEQTITGVWQDVLGVTPIGVHDDFFDLGGDSLAVVQVLDRISFALGIEVPHSAFAEPTVAAVAGRCTALRQHPVASPLRVFNPVRDESDASSPRPDGPTPFFCVHGGDGTAEGFRHLAEALGADQPFYGLQPVGDAGIARLLSVKVAAAGYLDAVIAECPTGPVAIGGYSAGGSIAMELALQLDAIGRRPELVVLFDAPLIGRLPLAPDPARLTELARSWVREWWRDLVMMRASRYLPASIRRAPPHRLGDHRMGTVALRNGRPLPPERRRRILEAFMLTAMRRWSARPYRGPVLLVRADPDGTTAPGPPGPPRSGRPSSAPATPRTEAESPSDASDRWLEIAPQAETVVAPGDHYSFMRPPLVVQTAGLVRAALARPLTPE